MIEEKFYTLDAHNWKTYDIQAPNGVYSLSVNPDKVEHTEVELVLNKEKWVLIEHYFPPETSNPDNNFFIRISDKPFAFE